jgi:hypothetical protein
VTTRTIIDLIVRTAAGHFGVTTAEIRSPRRSTGIVRARWVGLWLARTMTGMSYPKIGMAFGGIDHATVINACKRMRERLAADPTLREAVLEIEAQVAMNIPDVSGVARGMHLTFLTGPPRVLVERMGEQTAQFSACIETRQIGEGRGDDLFGPEEVSRCGSGTLWLTMPLSAEPLWEMMVSPVWHGLSMQVGPDSFKNGRVMLSPSTASAPAAVLEQLDRDTDRVLRTAHVLVDYGDAA